MKPAVGCLIGVFDLFHYGHLRLIERASKLCDKLVVVVVKDEAVRSKKGDGRPIVPQWQRVAIVSALYCVHMVVTSEGFDPYDAIVEYEQRTNNCVSFFFLGEDQSHIDINGVTMKGIKIIPLERTPGISTSDLARKLKC